MPKYIYLIDTELNNHIYSVPERDEIAVGRMKKAQLTIPCASEKCKYVSGIHCRLFRKDLGEKISEPFISIKDGSSDDKPSKNGTYMNGKPISNKEETPIKNGSILALADYKLRVVIEDSETIEDSKTI